MKFSDLDVKMRQYETAADTKILPGLPFIARLDGRGFTKLTERMNYAKPFDTKFCHVMVGTMLHLMEMGWRALYGFTESDEISILYDREEDAFNRKERKLNSVLAGEASAFFSSQVDSIAAFDCRIIPVPDQQMMIDYFRWRQEDANRNALNGWCYWKLRQSGKSKRQATSTLEGKGKDFKNELLHGLGVNYNKVPAWQKRGIGARWTMQDRIGWNPVKQEEVVCKRRVLELDWDLPYGDDYAEFLSQLTAPTTNSIMRV